MAQPAKRRPPQFTNQHFVPLPFLNVFYVRAVLFENWAKLRGKWHRVEQRTLEGDTTLPLMFRDVVHSLCNGRIWILRRLFSTWCPGFQHCEQRSLIILCKGRLYYTASCSPGDFVLNNGFGGEAHFKSELVINSFGIAGFLKYLYWESHTDPKYMLIYKGNTLHASRANPSPARPAASATSSRYTTYIPLHLNTHCIKKEP